jgi:hypothetical protein
MGERWGNGAERWLSSEKQASRRSLDYVQAKFERAEYLWQMGEVLLYINKGAQIKPHQQVPSLNQN